MRGAMIAAAVALAGAEPALACSFPVFALVPEPQGLSPEESSRFQQEAEASWRARMLIEHQYRAWVQADAVFLARIEELPPSTITGRFGSSMDVVNVRDVVLMPVTWLKGEGSASQFRIGPQEFNSCGPWPFWPALRGAPGDMHVVYVKGDPPSQETVLDVIPAADIRELETKSRMPDGQ